VESVWICAGNFDAREWLVLVYRWGVNFHGNSFGKVELPDAAVIRCGIKIIAICWVEFEG
jgi:hypothetical protein